MTSTKTTDKTTNASVIWNDIKERSINVFGMPQKVSELCKPVGDYSDKCYLTCRATAVFPFLETLLEKEYTCEQVEKYVVISKK